MLSRDWAEASASTIDFSEFEPDVCKLMAINFMYGQDITITIESVKGMTEIVNYLLMDELKHCGQELRECLQKHFIIHVILLYRERMRFPTPKECQQYGI